jgi:hypothetical protein
MSSRPFIRLGQMGQGMRQANGVTGKYILKEIPKYCIQGRINQHFEGGAQKCSYKKIRPAPTAVTRQFQTFKLFPGANHIPPAMVYFLGVEIFHKKTAINISCEGTGRDSRSYRDPSKCGVGPLFESVDPYAGQPGNTKEIKG